MYDSIVDMVVCLASELSGSKVKCLRTTNDVSGLDIQYGHLALKRLMSIPILNWKVITLSVMKITHDPNTACMAHLTLATLTIDSPSQNSNTVYIRQTFPGSILSNIDIQDGHLKLNRFMSPMSSNTTTASSHYVSSNSNEKFGPHYVHKNGFALQPFDLW